MRREKGIALGTAGPAAYAWLDQLLIASVECRPVLLVTQLHGDAPGAKWLLSADGELLAGPSLPDPVVKGAVEALSNGRVQCWEGDKQRYLFQPILPPPALVIAGGGHVAQPLAATAKIAGFAVTVIDDRPAYASPARFPSADRVICDEFRRGLDVISPGPSHHVVLVTRGHQHDLECLRHLINQPLAYLGMIGSRRRVLGIFQRLMDEGIRPEWLERVHAPIGLDLGAETPAEIAISIVAQLIQVRRGGTGHTLSRRAQVSIHRIRRDRAGEGGRGGD